MPLFNGRGQVGEYLKKINLDIQNIDIYHTWNFMDKSFETQSNELEKLKLYLSNKKCSNKIVFISTSVKSDSHYFKFKRKAERIVLKNSKKNLIIRLPSIIGKGVFEKLCKNLVEPFGVIEFVSLKEACDFIKNNLNKEGIISCKGWKIPAENVLEIINLK